MKSENLKVGSHRGHSDDGLLTPTSEDTPPLVTLAGKCQIQPASIGLVAGAGLEPEQKAVVCHVTYD